MKKGTITVEYVAIVASVQLSSVTDEQFDTIVYLLGETFGSIMVKADKQNKRVQVSWYGDYSQKKMKRVIEQVLTNNRTHHNCEIVQRA